MIPESGLVCAGDEIEAAQVSKDNPDFNVIPIRHNRKLTGYFERDSHTKPTNEVQYESIASSISRCPSSQNRFNAGHSVSA